ncbi:DUF6049 family protein [Aeromicrobium terrae]|uniref:Glycoprotein n=1 Tax=Aeromicrobium terrae TaxID=2498846 RepID=A0A5C8NER7_9ACTN|nr:DUF6049 family protein [Aeromicrobium terrae]TXL57393.1 hypothetical protein FHP06_13480 [Aeromicrobium terrae]
MGSRRAVIWTAVVSLLLPAVASVAPASAAPDKNPDLDVRITGLTPSRLSAGATVTMTGTVTNQDDHVWSDAQAYLVIPATPFTTRKQLDDAVADDAGYTGQRVVELDTIDDMGDLKPGSTTSFRVRVRYGALGISGAEGVYPVGVQILATDTDGTRASNAIARATTFLPLISSSEHPAVSAGLVWPFLMPDRRKPDGTYAAPDHLLDLISTGGRLRNQLDLASAGPARATTVILDPALLVGVDDLAHGRHLPDDFTVSDAGRASATRFRDDLVALARRDAVWVLGFDRPDVLALTRSSATQRLLRVVERATATTLATFQLTGRRVAWPTRKGVSADLLAAVRGTGEQPVLVTPGALPDWERRDGSLIQYTSTRGPVPLLVNDSLDAGVPGRTSAVTLRQRVLSEAGLASLQRGADPDSRADAVTIVDPGWDPGQVAPTVLDPVFTAPFVSGASLEDLITGRLTQYDDRVAKATVRPVDPVQIGEAATAAQTANLLASVVPDSEAVDAAAARGIASVLGVRWRDHRGEGLRAAEAQASAIRKQITRLTVEGPDAVTLSSSEGSFPLTISNRTDNPVRVAVSIDSSNPALDVPDLRGVEVAAGERRTVTVTVDMGRQTSATLSAHLTTPDGTTFGDPAVFNVRSSHVGTALWIAIGLAAAFVVVALVRRFRGRSA